MRHWLRASVAVCGTALTSAIVAPAPAQADVGEYLRMLVPKYVYLTPQQLLDEGYKVCRIIDSGKNSADAVGIVVNDLKVSVAAAFDIVTNAVTRLDC